ncbi:hypothetical protein GIB67_023203 [Kingdonia uniflora]|uniref:Uncharacterized protein n=1 Tax=Kingdonia uniflora TaxID=39325 RepID=A0A7J7MCB1_9MAGN|nr:hypothetical protein GIB67_023203 [Kingdonia uniflora]
MDGVLLYPKNFKNIILSLTIGNRGPMFTIGETLASIGFRNFQGLVLVYVGMGWVSKAMEMMLLSFVGPAVQFECRLSSR